MVKTYMTRLFTVLMLTMVSMGAWADVEVLFGEKGEKEFSGSGGKVSVLLQTEEDDGSTTVYISVYPSEGYSIKMEDITVVAVRPVGGESNTRTPEIAQDLALNGSKDAVKYPAGFINVDAPYDKTNHAASYCFTQCPNAEFAKSHGLLHVLPLLCNSDFWGISQIHGALIRKGTCGNSSVCDYLVVGDKNPIADKYSTVRDENGFIVSRDK